MYGFHCCTGKVCNPEYFPCFSDNPKCLVKSFEKYLSKLPEPRMELWLRPRESFIADDKYWYTEVPVGKNTLSTFMPTISKLGGLSRRYTNHSIRATSITMMDNAGVSTRHIMKVSGHKSANSIVPYSDHVSNNKKREISGLFSSATVQSETPNKKACVGKENQEMGNIPDIQELEDIFSQPFEVDQLTNSQESRLRADLMRSHVYPKDLSITSVKSQSNMNVSVPQQSRFLFQPVFHDNCVINITFHNN